MASSRPWRVYVLSGDPDGNPAVTPIGRYRNPSAALRIARSFVVYGELGGWHAQIAHADLNASLYLEPSTVDGRPAGVTYRPVGSECFDLIAELAPAFAILESEARP